MKVELNTNVVDSITPDTYGTGFQYEIKEDCVEDLKQGMIDIAERYLTDLLNETDFVDAKLIMKDSHSPREYNFTTDDIGFELEFNDSKIDDIAKFVEADIEGDREFVNWLKERYKSYDGFICTMPNSYGQFMDCLNGKDSEYYQWRAIAAFISYQIQDVMDLEKIQRDYIEDVWEYGNQNGLWIDEDEEVI